MAKNYTTKTSALKATTIDVRNIEATGTIDATNVEADSLKVGGKDIMEAIEEASDAAAAAAGIVVERDLNSSDACATRIVGDLTTESKVRSDLKVTIDQRLHCDRISQYRGQLDACCNGFYSIGGSQHKIADRLRKIHSSSRRNY
jgi:hypothetical protein